MKIPNQLRIGANTVKVERRPFAQLDAEGNGGIAFWEQNVLVLADDMPEDRTAVCFLHEILHFINTYLEEKEATFISEGLMQVIRDNNLDFRNETNT